jgi:exopolysaccharide biosynthesis predicted pyruvyltransferase EpsI
MPNSIVNYLEKYKGKTIYYFPNPGNAGDSIINYTAYQLMRKIGIEFRIVTDSDDLQDKIVFYGGGGNFVEYYTNASTFISKWHKKVNRLVVLPSTINDHRELLGELGKNVDLICREEVSYNYVNKHTRKPGVFLMNDLAFLLDISQYRKDLGIPDKENFRSRLNHSLLYSFSQFILRNGRILNSFRRDSEATGITIPVDNIDLARVLECTEMSEEAVKEITFGLLYFLDQFEQVNTNRLHICIAGILLGKKVNFFPNSYYKNKAVYDYSIKSRFNNVIWNQ